MATTTAAVKQQRNGRGRPRDADLDRRALDAAVTVYATVGWAGFSFEAVAKRAAVGKASLYLRWQSKDKLLVAALATRIGPFHVYDRGSVRVELLDLAHQVLDSYTVPEGLVGLRVFAEAGMAPDFFTRFTSSITTARVRGARAIVRRAIDRGELPEQTSPTLLLDALVGGIVNHVIVANSSPPELRARIERGYEVYLGRLVDFVLAAVGPR